MSPTCGCDKQADAIHYINHMHRDRNIAHFCEPESEPPRATGILDDELDLFVICSLLSVIDLKEANI
jgi:hypothetical protein